MPKEKFSNSTSCYTKPRVSLFSNISPLPIIYDFSTQDSNQVTVFMGIMKQHCVSQAIDRLGMDASDREILNMANRVLRYLYLAGNIKKQLQDLELLNEEAEEETNFPHRLPKA